MKSTDFQIYAPGRAFDLDDFAALKFHPVTVERIKVEGVGYVGGMFQQVVSFALKVSEWERIRTILDESARICVFNTPRPVEVLIRSLAYTTTEKDGPPIVIIGEGLLDGPGLHKDEYEKVNFDPEGLLEPRP